MQHVLGRGSVSQDRSVEPSEWGSQPLDFVLCVGSHNMRDEDVFANLTSKDVDDVPYCDYLPPATWTCRGGEQPSQASDQIVWADWCGLCVAGWAGLSRRQVVAGLAGGAD